MNKSRFARHVAKELKRTILGELVKFVKGDWMSGPNKDLISPDEAFVAVMDTSAIGFVKWGDGKIVDSKMGLVADEFQPPQRHDLDDYDSETWKVDKNSERIDPWQETSLLVLASVDSPHDLYTFSTSTKGGRGAILNLEEIHSKVTEGSGEYPVVTLGVGGYNHDDRAIGRVKTPVFKVIDAVDAAPFITMIAKTRGGAAFIPEAIAATEKLAAIEAPRPVDTQGVAYSPKRTWEGAPPHNEVPEGLEGDNPMITARIHPSEGEHTGEPGVQSTWQAQQYQSDISVRSRLREP